MRVRGDTGEMGDDGDPFAVCGLGLSIEVVASWGASVPAMRPEGPFFSSPFVSDDVGIFAFGEMKLSRLRGVRIKPPLSCPSWRWKTCAMSKGVLLAPHARIVEPVSTFASTMNILAVPSFLDAMGILVSWELRLTELTADSWSR